MVLMGAALLALAVAGAVRAGRDWPLWRALRRVRPATPQRLARAARDGHLDGRIVAVSGLAAAGADGPLASTVNDAPCVWHRHIVHRRQMRGYGRGRRVADRTSTEAFVLQPALARVGAGGGAIDGFPVEVRPAHMRVDGPAPGGVRVLPGLASDPIPLVQGGLVYRHREWLLPAGASLFILGELASAAAGPALARPRRGPHIISTRTHASLRRRLAVSAVGGVLVATVAGLTGALQLGVHYL